MWRVIIYIIILAICLPFLIPGHIFFLDRVMPISWFSTRRGDNVARVWWVSQLFEVFNMPQRILQKLILLSLFNLLVRGGCEIWNSKEDQSLGYVYILTILILIFSPFLYWRLMDGQVNVFLSYAMYPLFFICWWKRWGWWATKRWIAWVLLSLLLSLTSMHNTYFMLVVYGVGGILYMIDNISVSWRRIITWWLGILAINLIRLVPVLQWSRENTADFVAQLESFWEPMLRAFQSDVQWKNVYLHHAMMQWYRGEGQWRFLSIANNDFSYAIGIVLLILCLAWVVHFLLYQKSWPHRKLWLWILIVGVISYVLWIGISAENIFAPLNRWLFENLPYYSGMREPHKWIMFLSLVYAFFVPYLFLVAHRRYPSRRWMLSGVLPIVYVPYMLRWGWGQIWVYKYPSERIEARNYLSEQIDEKYDDCEYQFDGEKRVTSSMCYSSVVFPRHWYARVSWTNQTVLSSIMKFFHEDALYGDNLEMWDIYSRSTRLESKVVEKYISPRGRFRDEIDQDELDEFMNDLEWLWIQYIVVLKEDDFEWYEIFLDMLVEDSQISVEIENDMVRVYKIE